MVKMLKVNRKSKDALFRFIFGNPNHKEFALHLFNCLNHSHYTDPDDLEFVTLEDVLYINYKNDVAVLVNTTLHLWEEQSTWNPNMPYRMLVYYVLETQNYIEMTEQNQYREGGVKLPRPMAYVFYCGKEDEPAVKTLKLSALFEGEGEACCEFKTIVYNVGSKEFQAEEFCRELYEFTWIVNRMNKGIAEKKKLKNVIRETLDTMPDDFILKPYLKAEEKRVIQMLLTEFNAKKFYEDVKKGGYEDGMERGRAEGRIAGREEGISEGTQRTKEEMIHSMYEVGLSLSSIAEIAKCSEEEVKAILKMH